MYFEFEDDRPAAPHLVAPISRREGILLSIIAHLLLLIVALLLPRLPAFRAMAERAALEAERERAEAVEREEEAQRFVFVQPLVDVPAPEPPEVADLSDQDRLAQAPERSGDPENSLPFARGNTPEPVEAARQALAAGQGPGASAEPPVDGVDAETEGEPTGAPADAAASFLDDPALTRFEPSPEPDAAGARRAGGLLGDSQRVLDRYMQEDSFGNPQGGGGAYGPSIQFDTKGVDFGPWIRRFIAQIKRNWMIPYAAMAMHGNVVITFNVHRDGSITDLDVAAPSAVDAFNNAAFNALVATNPTQPLPVEYPDDRAFFTVTFYYNEVPPSR